MKINFKNQLYNTDGADSAAVAATDEIDPLSQAAGGIEAPSFPCLAPDRICRFEIKSCKKGPVSTDPTREVLTLILATTKDYTDTKGKPLRAGFKGYHRIGISPTEETPDKRGRDMKAIAKDLAMVLKACGMKDATPRQLIDRPDMVEQQIIDMKVGLKKEANGFPESNSFAFVLPA